MRLSQFPLNTSKDIPADAEISSHQLMLRSGLIRKVAAGLYTWSPLGLRVLKKVEAIVREEMERAGAFELLMPSIQPSELWQESGRWEAMGPEMLRLQDRHGRDFCYGPTHEEVITAWMRSELKSYRQLPLNLFQIQTKFRDETRPRFGVMRAREFLMKDAYSFHRGGDCLEQTYQTMRAAYTRIFERLGVEFRVVNADSGNIGGSKSEEFHVLADSGEDLLAISSTGDYAANVEAAPCAPPSGERAAPSAELSRQDTPGQKTIADITKALDVSAEQCAKTLVLRREDGQLAAVVIRGDHELNLVKAGLVIGGKCEMASDAEVFKSCGAAAGSVGPVGLSIPVYADHAAAQLHDFVCGANQADAHLTGVNWGRDLPEPTVADLRNILAGDIAADGGSVTLKRGIEVGHIFQLGRKYSEAMKLSVPDEQGAALIPTMGCYGIGVSRIVGAVVEQCHDDNGIIWPDAVAPFSVVIVAMNPKQDPEIASAIESLYTGLRDAGVAVLLDDRDLRPGHRFADADLIGLPYRVVASARGFAAGTLEFKARTASEATDIAWSADAVRELLACAA